MAKGRLYRDNVTDGIVVHYPNPRLWERDKETESEFVKRVTDRNEQKGGEKSLANTCTVLAAECDSSDLPPREELCTDCDEMHPCRNAWRWNPGLKKVEIDPAVPNSHRELAHLEHDLDRELDKPIPDGVVLARCQRDIQRRIKKNSRGEV